MSRGKEIFLRKIHLNRLWRRVFDDEAFDRKNEYLWAIKVIVIILIFPLYLADLTLDSVVGRDNSNFCIYSFRCSIFKNMVDEMTLWIFLKKFVLIMIRAFTRVK